jgi:glycosyltransferase involved in cell wall biosynthesis
VARFVCGIPIVYDWDDLEGLHGFTTMHGRKLRYQLLETVNEVAFTRMADATVVASCHLKEFAGQIGVPGDRLFYGPTVADSDKFHPDISGKDVCQRYSLEGCKVLLYCGNLMKCNGVRVENIIHTMALLLKQDPAYRLLVIGDGELLSCDGLPGVLPRLAETYGIADKIVFTGGIPYDDVPGHIAAADLCLALFPVNLITMTKSPLKVYEYLASGKPVVARDVGEMSLCIEDGVNGRLVYSDDPTEYAAKINSIFADENARVEMGRNARRIIEERYLWCHSAAEALKACARAAGARPARRGRCR